MYPNDPLVKVEKMVKDMHDNTCKYTQPVVSKYPLLFSFLVVFSVASILHGFELVTDNISFFRQYPVSLIIIGALVLFFTGMLYKSLDKMQ